MDRNQALVQATKIAHLLIAEAEGLGQTVTREVIEGSLLRSLSIMIAAERGDVNALDPSFCEIILFGSAAREGSSPSDVDLMVFDRGFYSNVFLEDERSEYGIGTSENLQKLLSGWFGGETHDGELREILRVSPVDLLIFPLAILTDPGMRREVARQQHDPDFFRNAFSDMMRFDPDSQKFVRINLSYFEKKYGVELTDLK